MLTYLHFDLPYRSQFQKSQSQTIDYTILMEMKTIPSWIARHDTRSNIS